MKNKIRLDVLIYSRGLAKSREKAKQLILSGCVYSNEKLLKKPGNMVDNDVDIQLILKDEQYVSRGAYKLKKAIETFNISLEGRNAIDIGASTGGFTDYMLKNGCNKVYAVDVGHKQLDESLLIDGRVISLEKTNFRYVDMELFQEDINFTSIDVSFISLEYILPNVSIIGSEDVDIVALVKPQFEAGKEYIGKNGIVKDKKVHNMVLEKILRLCDQNNLFVCGLTYSPITGGDGNKEYLIHIKKTVSNYFILIDNTKIRQAIDEAFEILK